MECGRVKEHRSKERKRENGANNELSFDGAFTFTVLGRRAFEVRGIAQLLNALNYVGNCIWGSNLKAGRA
jgi:hypothetical protein